MKNIFFKSLSMLLACTIILNGQNNSTNEEDTPASDFDTTIFNTTGILAQVLQLVKQKHYLFKDLETLMKDKSTVDPKEFETLMKDLENTMYDGIDTMLSHLDPHLRIFSA